MLKSALVGGLVGLGLLFGGAASANGPHHGGGHHGAHSGGFISIRLMPPPPPPRPRCVPGIKVDNMQADQAARIRDGRRQGDLTVGELDRLNAEQDRIAAIERRMRSDGCLTAAERDELVRLLEAASRNIYRERHNAQRRGDRGNGHGHGGHGGHHGGHHGAYMPAPTTRITGAVWSNGTVYH